MFIRRKALRAIIEREKNDAYHQGYGDGYMGRWRVEHKQAVIAGTPKWKQEINNLKGEL